VPEVCELIVFDLDGVLADTARCHARAWAQLFAEWGRPAPEYAAIAGRRTVDVIVEAGAVPPGAVAGWVARKQELARRLLATDEVLFPDTRAALRAMARRGLRLAVGTGASRATAETVLSRLAGGVAFEAVVTADDVARGKPDPEVYDRVLALTAVKPERALVVEDSPAGVEAGLAAGARVASVRSPVRAAHPRFVGGFEDLAALAAWLGCTA
jgi:HAD superfamily hydrolase (TIGR01509 family)